MVIITVKYERDGKSASETMVATHVVNEQTAMSSDAVLRPSEAVEHRLRLDAGGIIKLEVRGCA